MCFSKCSTWIICQNSLLHFLLNQKPWGLRNLHFKAALVGDLDSHWSLKTTGTELGAGAYLTQSKADVVPDLPVYLCGAGVGRGMREQLITIRWYSAKTEPGRPQERRLAQTEEGQKSLTKEHRSWTWRSYSPEVKCVFHRNKGVVSSWRVSTAVAANETASRRV